MGILRGHCFCREVTFTVMGPPRYSCFCHCESCQRAAGGAYVPWATFARNTFAITSGTMTAHPSSPGVARGLCATCGTSLTYENNARDGQIDITLTSFDDPSLFSPQAHIWVEDKQPWVSIADDLPQYQKNAG